jgi:hypothetical protein
MGFGVEDPGLLAEGGALRRESEEEERVPMWYLGIIAFAVSLSVCC